MRTAKSIIMDILNEELKYNKSNEYIASRILHELRLEQTVEKSEKTHHPYISYQKDKKSRKTDELYQNILKYSENESMAVRIYSTLRRNGFDSTDKLLELDGSRETISRMRNCGKLTTAAILDIILQIKAKESGIYADSGAET